MIMGEAKMEKEKSESVQGKPWVVVGRFDSYEKAKTFREELEDSENPPKEIKIKHLSSSSSFVVKVRKEEQKRKDKKNKVKK